MSDLPPANIPPEESESAGIMLPDGSTAEPVESVTDRKKERSHEDRQFTPVIIKRTDVTRRHPDDTLETAIEEGLEQLTRPAVSLLLSSIAAGLIVGFSPMAVAVVSTALLEHGITGMSSRAISALVYPLGFVICVMSGAQLFTEHTATALYPVLDRKASFLSVLRLWALVAIGNIVGAGLGAALHYLARDVVQDQPLPWQPAQEKLTPERVLQSLGGLFRQIGTPATAPRTRGKSPGWPQGRQRTRPERYPVVRKGKKKAKAA